MTTPRWPPESAGLSTAGSPTSARAPRAACERLHGGPRRLRHAGLGEGPPHQRLVRHALGGRRADARQPEGLGDRGDDRARRDRPRSSARRRPRGAPRRRSRPRRPGSRPSRRRRPRCSPSASALRSTPTTRRPSSRARWMARRWCRPAPTKSTLRMAPNAIRRTPPSPGPIRRTRRVEHRPRVRSPGATPRPAGRGSRRSTGSGPLAARLAAILLLPLYTRYLTPADYGHVELCCARAGGLGVWQARPVNAFFRFFFDDDDLARRRDVFAHALLVAGGRSRRVPGAAVVALGGPDRPTCSSTAASRRRGARAHRRARRLDHRPVRAGRPRSSACSSGRSPTPSRRSSTCSPPSAAPSRFVVWLDAGAEGLLLGNFLGTARRLRVPVWSERSWLRGSFERTLLRRCSTSACRWCPPAPRSGP